LEAEPQGTPHPVAGLGWAYHCAGGTWHSAIERFEKKTPTFLYCVVQYPLFVIHKSQITLYANGAKPPIMDKKPLDQYKTGYS
jgi:hypothetical protein